LLRPSPELNDIILGVSSHVHLLVSPTSAYQHARFMQFLNANIAKEVTRFHNWTERVWFRRYRAIPVVDDEAEPARMRYLLPMAQKRVPLPDWVTSP